MSNPPAEADAPSARPRPWTVWLLVAVVFLAAGYFAYALPRARAQRNAVATAFLTSEEKAALAATPPGAS